VWGLKNSFGGQEILTFRQPVVNFRQRKFWVLEIANALVIFSRMGFAALHCIFGTKIRQDKI